MKNDLAVKNSKATIILNIGPVNQPFSGKNLKDTFKKIFQVFLDSVRQRRAQAIIFSSNCPQKGFGVEVSNCSMVLEIFRQRKCGSKNDIYISFKKSSWSKFFYVLISSRNDFHGLKSIPLICPCFINGWISLNLESLHTVTKICYL